MAKPDLPFFSMLVSKLLCKVACCVCIEAVDYSRWKEEQKAGRLGPPELDQKSNAYHFPLVVRPHPGKLTNFLFRRVGNYVRAKTQTPTPVPIYRGKNKFKNDPTFLREVFFFPRYIGTGTRNNSLTRPNRKNFFSKILSPFLRAKRSSLIPLANEPDVIDSLRQGESEMRVC